MILKRGVFDIVLSVLGQKQKTKRMMKKQKKKINVTA